ncbi:hypothetical protein [Apilactobacillus xinyiensis]|uniref:hypothetical protein n=1 Tax=Apilactobacillus xinyiensis TaxID=2841032 RepID=UPI00200FB10B|nr:hypothetical protein [Apilactobacillus xinyiensis]MCL0319316.1 hypothetical protein [Apilactobacillus xinyiensis]
MDSKYKDELKAKIQTYKDIMNNKVKDEEKIKQFSWVLEEDKQFINDKQASVRFGIPIYPTGNVKNGNLYLCLNNPSMKTPKNMIKIKHIQ